MVAAPRAPHARKHLRVVTAVATAELAATTPEIVAAADPREALATETTAALAVAMLEVVPTAKATPAPATAKAAE